MRYTKKKKHCLWCGKPRGTYKGGNGRTCPRKITLWGICNVCLFNANRTIKKKHLTVTKGKKRLRPHKKRKLKSGDPFCSGLVL